MKKVTPEVGIHLQKMWEMRRRNNFNNYKKKKKRREKAVSADWLQKISGLGLRVFFFGLSSLRNVAVYPKKNLEGDEPWDVVEA